MFQKSILLIGAMATLGAALIGSPARAEGFGIFAGVGVAFGFGDGSSTMRSLPAGSSVRFVGVPGRQRPVQVYVPGRPGTRVATADLFPDAGPGRRTVCAWQDRWDRHERYAGSQRLCWVEAR